MKRARVHKALAILLLIAGLLAIAGCGNKGPLKKPAAQTSQQR